MWSCYPFFAFLTEFLISRKMIRNGSIMRNNHVDAVTYWTAQQTYRLELAKSRALAAAKSVMSSDTSSSSSSPSTSSSSILSTSSSTTRVPISASSIDLFQCRPKEFLIMPAKASVPQVIWIRSLFYLSLLSVNDNIDFTLSLLIIIFPSFLYSMDIGWRIEFSFKFILFYFQIPFLLK